MKRILFVCHGNICRSPMAEFVARHIARQAGRGGDFEIASAATSAEELGNPVYPPARQELARHGIGCEGKTARRLSRDDYDRHDMIVGMDGENLRNMLRLFGGDPEGKLSLLLDHLPATSPGRRGREVADPWYTRDFAAAYADIEAGCRGLMERLMVDE